MRKKRIGTGVWDGRTGKATMEVGWKGNGQNIARDLTVIT